VKGWNYTPTFPNDIARKVTYELCTEYSNIYNENFRLIYQIVSFMTHSDLKKIALE